MKLISLVKKKKKKPNSDILFLSCFKSCIQSGTTLKACLETWITNPYLTKNSHKTWMIAICNQKIVLTANCDFECKTINSISFYFISFLPIISSTIEIHIIPQWESHIQLNLHGFFT